MRLSSFIKRMNSYNYFQWYFRFVENKIISQSFCNIKRRHWSFHFQRFFRFRGHWSWLLFHHWNSTNYCLRKTWCNSNNVHDLLCHYELKQHRVNKLKVLVWGIFVSIVYFFIRVDEAIFPFIFRVFKIKVVFFGAKIRLISC